MADGTFVQSSRGAEARAFDLRASDSRVSGGLKPDPRVAALARLIGQSDPFAPPVRRDDTARWQSSEPPRLEGLTPTGPRNGRPYGIPPNPPRQAPAPAVDDSYDADDHQEAHYDSAYGGKAGGHFGERAEADAYEQGEYGDDYADEEASGFDEDASFEQDLNDPDSDYQDEEAAPPKPRRTLKVAAAAVLGLALFGTAGAFGYHTIFKGKRTGPPPIIRADNSPTKVAPAGAGGLAGDVNPKTNERLGGGSQERLVRREEDPVVLRDPARAPAPNLGMALAGITAPAPAAPAPMQATAAPAPAAAPPAGTAGAADEAPPPKRVRTVSIRVDQPQGAATAAPSRSPSPARVAAAAAPAVSAAPLALTPQAVGAAPAIASTEPPPPAPARARAAAEGNGFVVQVSAQKSESEAQASFRSMQSRYAVLNGRQPLIRRKERPDHGVVYAALVGPFGTRDEAIQLCESLKMAGGDCFVQKN